MVTYSSTSIATRRLSSSLYLVAALDVYLVLISLLFRAAVPPLDWKNLMADSLPPTFIVRSWFHCHTGARQSRLRLVGLAGARTAPAHSSSEAGRHSWPRRVGRTVEIGRLDEGDVSP